MLMNSELNVLTGLKITAVQRTMSSQNGYLTRQNVPLLVMLTGHTYSTFLKTVMFVEIIKGISLSLICTTYNL